MDEWVSASVYVVQMSAEPISSLHDIANLYTFLSILACSWWVEIVKNWYLASFSLPFYWSLSLFISSIKVLNEMIISLCFAAVFYLIVYLLTTWTPYHYSLCSSPISNSWEYTCWESYALWSYVQFAHMIWPEMDGINKFIFSDSGSRCQYQLANQ